MGAAAAILIASGVFAAWALTRSRSQLASQPHPASQSPLDEAERILAARYASGSISPQEYRRMLTILRT